MQDTPDIAQPQRPNKWGITYLSPEETAAWQASREYGAKADEMRAIADDIVKNRSTVRLPIINGTVMGMGVSTFRSYFAKHCGPRVASVALEADHLVIFPFKSGSKAAKTRRMSRCEILALAAALPENLGHGLFLMPHGQGVRLDLLTHFMKKYVPEGHQVFTITKDRAPHARNGQLYAKFGYPPLTGGPVQIAAQPFLRDENGVVL